MTDNVMIDCVIIDDVMTDDVMSPLATHHAKTGADLRALP